MTDWYTDDDVERAAGAIYEDRGRLLSTERHWPNATDGDKRYCRSYARAALSAVKPNQWQTMESAPEDGSYILGTWASTWKSVNMHVEPVYFVEDEWYYTYDGDAPIEPPSHWMPLPQPPEGE